MIRAIVFDFDGLIFDTETPAYEAIRDVYRLHGAELTLAFWGTVIGTQGIDIYAPITEMTGKEIDKEAVRNQFRELHRQKMGARDIRPGVLDYLKEAKELGLKVGLASSSDRNWIDTHLARFGLAEYFDCTFSASDVSKVKPDPELYLSALKALGVEPWEAVAFEDSPNGSLAAKRAGMFCAVFPNEITTMLKFGENIDLRYSSMTDIALRDLIAELNARSSS